MSSVASPVGRLFWCPDASPAPLDDLDALVAVIIVDAYGDDEPQVGFLEVFNQEVRLPAAATVLGMPMEVVGFDYRDGRQGIVAECRRDASHQAMTDASHQAMTVVDLVFPRDSVAAWVQAAYRRWLGLTPCPYEMPPRWRPSWL